MNTNIYGMNIISVVGMLSVLSSKEKLSCYPYFQKYSHNLEAKWIKVPSKSILYS